MDINRLYIFLNAAQTLNFSKTAKQFCISQSTVSKHIQELEKQLEVTLFDRAGPRIRLSQAGEALIPWARQLVNECERFQELAHSFQDDVAGPLRIACTTAAGKYILPMLAVRFRKRFPLVDVSMLPCRPPEVDRLMRDEQADIAVVSFEVADPKFECQHFFYDHIILIAPVDHSWSQLSGVEPEDLTQETMIIREPTSGTRRTLLSALAAHDIAIEDLKIILELGNSESIVAAVAAGIGVSFVSQAAASFALQAGVVCEVPVKGFDLERKICMVRGSAQPTTRPAELFWGFLHDPVNADLFG